MKRVFNLLVVDESGSMEIIRKQALSGMNETLQTIRKMQEKHKNLEQRVTLITFDSSETKLRYDNVAARNIHRMGWRDYVPGGGTPLYDAIGRGISRINSQASAEDSVLVTIITDGEENCSSEYSLRMVKNLIDKLKAQHWTFTFIGTDNSLQFRQDDEGTQEMFARERKCRERFSMNLSMDLKMPNGRYFADEK